LIRTPTPDFPKMSLPIYSEVGPSLQSFPPYFASISSFCTIASSDAVNQVVVFLGSQHIPSGDGRPSKCFRFEKDVSKTRKDMAKIFETIHNNMLSYIMLEFQILKTWLVIEFYPAMRVNPPPKNPSPLTKRFQSLITPQAMTTPLPQCSQLNPVAASHSFLLMKKGRRDYEKFRGILWIVILLLLPLF
jgi:hypothetical protein